jgi:hypothetical protein
MAMVQSWLKTASALEIRQNPQSLVEATFPDRERNLSESLSASPFSCCLANRLFWPGKTPQP